MIRNTKRSTVGVATVIGFLLIFSFLIIAAAQYQANVIPIQEENKEIQHNRDVRAQLAGLQSSIRGTANSNEVRTQQIDLGTTYDSQVIFGLIPAIHPPPPSGTITYTAANSNLEIDNAEGQRGAEEFWTGDPVVYSNDATGWFSYEPDYNRLVDAPTLYYENGIVYDELPNGNRIFRSDQNLVSGKNITITSIVGDIDTSSAGTRVLETHPVSAPRTRIAVQAPSGQPLEITLPTRLSAAEWDTLLEEEKTTNGGFVTGVSNTGGDAVTITLQQDTTYTLGLARVFLTTRASETPIPQSDKQYISWDEDQVIIRERSETTIDAQVADKYNNPIPGVNVEAFARDSNGDCIGNFQSAAGPPPECDTNVDQPGFQTSAEAGQVTFVYEAPEVEEDTQISITLQFEP